MDDISIRSSALPTSGLKMALELCRTQAISVYCLNEKVGFKIPTTRYRKNSILCGALHIGTAKWTSGVRWSFGAS